MDEVNDSLTTLPPLSEKDFLRQVVELAEIRGWQWLHLRPAMTRDSWRTPISGPLGKGFVDLLMIRDSSLIFAELKAEGGRLSPDQDRVIEMLNGLIEYRPDGTSRVEVFVWRPSDWDSIEKALR